MKWTKEKIATLRELYPVTSCRILADKLGCTVSAVKSKVKVLCLKHAPGYNRMDHSVEALTAEERQFIANNYTKYTNHELAAMMKRSESAIQRIRRILGITKENLGRFKKGHRPWSFRTKGLVKSTPGMKRTQFKKGQLPKQTLYDGAITVRIDHKDRSGRAYKWIRVALGKWEMYPRWKWIQKNGPVPKGHLVIFKDGDSMNTEDSNLALITMADNARRNYNPARAQRASKELTDNYIAGRMARGDKKTREALIKAAPELIELKRKQLQLKRKLNHEKKHKTGKNRGQRVHLQKGEHKD